MMVKIENSDLDGSDANECNSSKGKVRSLDGITNNNNNNNNTFNDNNNNNYFVSKDETQLEVKDNCESFEAEVDGSKDVTVIADVDDDEENVYEYDTDNEDAEDKITDKIDEDMIKKMKVTHETICGQVLPTLDQTTFGEVAVSNSTNVRIGNTTTYKGPVTIKQFVYSNTTSDTNPINNCKNDKEFKIVNSLPEFNLNGSTVPINPEYSKVKDWLWTWRCAAILCVIGLILITSTVIIIVTLKPPPEFPELKPPIDPDDILTDDIRFVKRVEWGAQPAEKPAERLKIIPAPYVLISHTASEACFNQADCTQRVRLAQTMHIEGNKWDDIGYNFLVGGDGLVYIGRGWDVTGAHAFGYNSKSIGISCIGTFNKLSPSKRQLYSLAKLIAVGVEHGKIANNYTLLGHRQISTTKSPGDVLYRIIQSWDHWAEIGKSNITLND